MEWSYSKNICRTEIVGYKKVILHIMSDQILTTHKAYYILPTKIAMDIALQNSTAEVMLSWSAVVSIAGCQNQIKRN